MTINILAIGDVVGQTGLVFLKEHVSLRAWGGLALCVIGAIAIGYTPPEGAGGGLFYLGIAFAFLAAFGWAAEGVCVTSGMDFIEPAVALNVYQIVSSLLYALLIFVICDYITGVMGAISDKKLSSAVGFRGICRKVLIFILVGIANVIDINVLGQVGVLRTAVIFFYISNEGLSLIENAAHLGLPIPGKLKEVLEQLHNRDEKDTDKEEK